MTDTTTTETDAGKTDDKDDKKAPVTDAADKGAKGADDATKTDDAAAIAEKAAAEKARLAEDRRIEKKANALAEAKVKEALAAKEREAAEAAENAKKPEIDRLTAEKAKLEKAMLEIVAERDAAKLAVSLADELTDQDLKPAGPGARKHIAAAFKVEIDAGKDPVEAMKAVHKAEPYLFAAAPVAGAEKTEKVQPGKTAPGERGPTVTERSGAEAGKGETQHKNPGDLTDPKEIAAEIRRRHGLRVANG